MCSLKVDQLSVTFDPETAEVRSFIVTHPAAAIALQPSKLRHVKLLLLLDHVACTQCTDATY